MQRVFMIFVVLIGVHTPITPSLATTVAGTCTGEQNTIKQIVNVMEGAEDQVRGCSKSGPALSVNSPFEGRGVVLIWQASAHNQKTKHTVTILAVCSMRSLLTAICTPTYMWSVTKHLQSI